MMLRSLELKNFRCFAQLTVEFHPQLTVLVANNGQGKTAILDALRIGLWSFLSGFDLANPNTTVPAANSISIEDARVLKKDGSMIRQLPVEIILDSMVGAIHAGWGSFSNHTWKRYRDSEKTGSHTKDDESSRELKKYSASLQQDIRDLDKLRITLPVFGYYGTGRLWSEKRLTKAKRNNKEIVDANTRTFAYMDCLDPSSSYKQFEEWFISAFIKMREDQIRRLEAGHSQVTANPLVENPITVIQQAVNELLASTGWRNISYSETHEKSLVMHHDLRGTLKVDQLSDGIKNMVAMVADIAYRCALLNPHLGAEAALRSYGLVMIDEVDMHLHPQWQQTVMAGLLSAFPKIQFIVTTHSPQVLSTVERENIRLLELDSNGIGTASIPIADSYGEPSHDVLQAIMQVDPQPPVPEKVDLEHLTALVDQGLYQSEQAQQLLASLKQRLSPSHPQIERIERSIRRQEALAR